MRISTLTSLVLLPALAGAFAVAASVAPATLPPEGGWTAGGSIEKAQADATLAAKPHNLWTSKSLAAAGFTGCVKVEPSVDLSNPPVAHVVRLPVAEGWNWTVMPAAEVASRLAAFGGTATTSDDVKVVGNCYGA